MKLEGTIGAVRCMCELSDGRLATGGLFAVISIWNLSTRVVETVLKGHNGTIQVLLQLTNGDLVSGSGDWTIKIWTMKEEKKTLVGHRVLIRGLIEKKNVRNQIISVSEDNVIKLWNTKTAEVIFTLIHCHQDIVFSCVCLSDGRVVSCSQDKTIKIWNIDSIFEKFKTIEYPPVFVKKRDNTKEERRNINTSNEIVYLNNIIQNGTNKLNASIRKPYEYLPFEVINKVSTDE